MNELDRSLTKVAIIGACGKMGSGISLLLLHEMSKLELSKTGILGSGVFQINLIDQSEKGLSGLYRYLKDQLRRYAEQMIQQLRDSWKNNPSLISNREIIDAYVDGALSMVRLSTDLHGAKEANLIFEAVLEDFDVKVDLFRQLESINPNSPLYFTNTSSIPIHCLAKGANIGGRLIGFHFYNPPAVQKLLELIQCSDDPTTFQTLAESLAQRLGKIVVHSKDIAGFIGNGQFIREVIYALTEVEKLTSSMTLVEAIAFYDTLTRDLLIRPMGLFQLIDYVGLDVVQHITRIMAEYLPDPSFSVPIIDQFLLKGVKGGQTADGKQKSGIFSYNQGRIEKIYDSESGTYQPLPDLSKRFDSPNAAWKPWKAMQKEKDLSATLESYFKQLRNEKSEGSRAAIQFLENSKKIAEQLVADGVAKSMDDVSTVMKNGFFHLYGPGVY